MSESTVAVESFTLEGESIAITDVLIVVAE